jgi:hypothetical protein
MFFKGMARNKSGRPRFGGLGNWDYQIHPLGQVSRRCPGWLSNALSNISAGSLWRDPISTFYIDPGSPWQNGYVESFNSRFRDECLNGE